MPSVAGLFQPGDHAAYREVLRPCPFELVPGQWRGNGRSGAAAWRVSRGKRLATNVHVVVDENFAGSLLNGPLESDLPRMLLEDVPPHHLANLPRRIERHISLNGHEHVKSGLAGRLHHGMQSHLIEKSTNPERDLPAGRETLRVELRLRPLLLLSRVDV